MNRILVSDVHEVTHALEHDGYKLISNQKGKLLFKRGNEELEVFLADYIDEEVKTVKPNYENCSINVIASIRKHFNKEFIYSTNPIVDKLLETKKYNHIAVLLLDGMGSYIIRKNLCEDSFLAINKVSDMYAVFPSTTACAVPALQSGLAPIVTVVLSIFTSSAFNTPCQSAQLKSSPDSFPVIQRAISLLNTRVPNSSVYTALIQISPG